MQLTLTGLWAEAEKLFPDLKAQIPAAINKAMLGEAQDLRKRMVKQFADQQPVSGQWAPLSPMTLRARKVQGFKGNKILIRSADLRNSIQLQPNSPAAQIFVGVNRTVLARVTGGGKAMALVNIGLVHEFGATLTITVTRKMQRYLFGVLLKTKGGRDLSGRYLKKGAKAGSGGSGRFKVGAKITIRIPARPFVGPAVEAKSPAEYEASVAARMAVLLRSKLGKP